MLRPYNISDKPQIIEVFRLNIPTYFDPQEEKNFEEYINKHSDTYFVIELDNKIVGCGGYHFDDGRRIGRISWDFVHPDYKGKGLGKLLVGHCVGILKTTPTVVKLVVTTSQLANEFYAKFGFTLKTTEKNFWGKGLDLYVMEMENTFSLQRQDGERRQTQKQ